MTWYYSLAILGVIVVISVAARRRGYLSPYLWAWGAAKNHAQRPRCPQCDEVVRPRATRCPHCQSEIRSES